MAFESITAQIGAMAGDAYATWELILGPTAMNVLVLAFGIAFYAILVGTFYSKISRRVLFRLNLETRFKGFAGHADRFLRALSFILSYTLIFPAITFIWFFLLAIVISLLTKTASLETVLLTSLAVVASIRICAYYKEPIAIDLAKILPLAMLGVFIVDPTIFSGEVLESRISEFVATAPEFAGLFAITISLEWLMRIILAIKEKLMPEKPAIIEVHKKEVYRKRRKKRF